MNRTYLVIGGSTGIGKSLVKRLGNKNKIIATYHNHQLPSEGTIQYIHFDIESEDSMSIDIDQLDGIVYCPGTINLKPFHRLPSSEFLHDFQINVIGAIRVIQQFIPILKKSQNASIVLFSTVAVQQGMSFHSSVAASKGAIEGLTRSLAAELAPTVRVNAIAPSIVNTPLAERFLNSEEKRKSAEKRHPLHRFGHPDDIAAMASFLLSEESSWITGQIVKVDGGMSSIKIL